MRFFRHRGIYRSDRGSFKNQTRAGALPPAGNSHPGPRTRREEHALLIVPMSSDRLFLDRVARQHGPSPLHRHAQINMHFSQARAKGDILTLRAGGHFYFALTRWALGLSTTVVCDTIPAVLLPTFNYGWDALGLFANEERFKGARMLEF